MVFETGKTILIYNFFMNCPGEIFPKKNEKKPGHRKNGLKGYKNGLIG